MNFLLTNFPKRKPNRLKLYDYSQAGCYFVTICTKDRKALFGRLVGATVPGRPSPPAQLELSRIGQIVENAIQYNNRDSVSIPKYTIMPNHIHMIIVLPSMGDGRPEASPQGRSPLRMIVRNMKSFITKQCGAPIWQKSFHDHVIRDEKDYERIWQYIDENPAKWAEDKYFLGP